MSMKTILLVIGLSPLVALFLFCIHNFISATLEIRRNEKEMRKNRRGNEAFERFLKEYHKIKAEELGEDALLRFLREKSSGNNNIPFCEKVMRHEKDVPGFKEK